MDSPLLEDAVRALLDADTSMGVKKLTARIQNDHPSWGVSCKVVKEAIAAIKLAKGSVPVPAATLSFEDPCWGCGKMPADGQIFLVCAK